MWAVLTDPEKRHGNWSEDEFFASGVVDVQRTFETLQRHGVEIRRQNALDFGCGIGRLTFALAAAFDEAHGVDVAPEMIGAARRHAVSRGVSNCYFCLNESDDLRVYQSARFDLILSLQVLQHMPTSLATQYLAEFARILTPVGAVVIHVPTRSTQPFGTARMHVRNAALGLRQFVTRRPGMQMHAWSPTIMHETLRRVGLEIAGEDHAGQGPHWESATYVAVKKFN